MRITNSMMVNNMISTISKNLKRMDKYQYQMSTGKKIAVPSDDPVVASRALKLRTDVAQIKQYQKNVKDGSSWLNITETALNNMGDVLKRADELAVQAATGTMSAEDMKTSAKEISQLKEQLVELSNSSYAGRYIFSGFKTDQKLITKDSSGNYVYNIDLNKTTPSGVEKENINYEIGVGNDINVNVIGSDLFSSSDADGVINKGDVPGLIQVMTDLEKAMNDNDHTAVGDALTKIQAEHDNVLQIRADVGARSNRLELTEKRLDTDNYNFTDLMSQNEDADMSDVIINLTNEENVYKSSLSVGARIIQPSLVDFLS